MKKYLLPILILIIFSLSANAQTPVVIAGTGQSGYNGNNLPALSTELSNPGGLTFNKEGSLYYADPGNNIVRKIDASGNIVTVAGDPTSGGYNGDGIAATSAWLASPIGLSFDTAGNLYIADASNNRIRKVDTAGIITTVAGTGAGGYNGDGILASSAEINFPSGITFDAAGNMYFTEQSGHRVRKVDNYGYISTVAGNGTSGYSGDNGVDTDAEMVGPYGICLDKTGNIYITDVDNGTVRKVNTSGIITTVAGTGTDGFNGDGIAATTAELSLPEGVVVDNTGNLYIADGSNYRIREVNPNGIISTLVSDTGKIIANIEFESAVDMDGCGNLYFVDADKAVIWEVGAIASVSIGISPQSPSVCNGQSVTLTISGSNGNYTWSPATGINDTTGDSIIANPTITTIYSVTGTSSAGCMSTGTDTVNVISSPSLIIQPPSPSVCPGQNITLTVPVSGSGYLWSPSSTLSSSTGDSVIAAPLVQTTYTVTGTDSLGCTASASDIVSISPVPDTPTITHKGNFLISSATQGNQWVRNDTALNGATNQTYTITIEGWYKVIAQNPANGCNSTSDSIDVTTGINQLSVNSEQLSIYPNPTSGQFTIKLNDNQTNYLMEVYNIVGEKIYQSVLDNSQNMINLSAPDGMYFVYLKSGDWVEVKKILIAK